MDRTWSRTLQSFYCEKRCKIQFFCCFFLRFYSKFRFGRMVFFWLSWFHSVERLIPAWQTPKFSDKSIKVIVCRNLQIALRHSMKSCVNVGMLNPIIDLRSVRYNIVSKTNIQAKILNSAIDWHLFIVFHDLFLSRCVCACDIFSIFHLIRNFISQYYRLINEEQIKHLILFVRFLQKKILFVLLLSSCLSIFFFFFFFFSFLNVNICLKTKQKTSHFLCLFFSFLFLCLE